MGSYEIHGVIRTAEGDPVDLPDVEILTVPVRWLRSADADLPPTHRDITGSWW